MHKPSGISEGLVNAAVEAEFATGEREATVEAAKAHIAIRVARIGLGSTIVVLGLAMLVLPGPGVFAIAGGLFILAKDIAWADRLLQRLRKKVPGVPSDGRIPRSQVITMLVMAAATLALSAWWFLLR